MVAETYSDPRPFLITGDTGFVGTRLRYQLLAEGFGVVGVHRRHVAAPPNYNYFPIEIDLADQEMVNEHADIFRSVRAVIHLAGRIPQDHNLPLEMHIAANLRATENVLQVLDGSGVPLVLTSTMCVYGMQPDTLPVGEDQLPRPTTAFGISKLAAEYAAERLTRARRVAAIALRFPTIFGVGSDVALQLYASKALSGETVSVYGGGEIIRDYVYVDDVLDACLLAAEKAASGTWAVYHIGSGESRSLGELAQLTIDAVGRGILATNDRPGPSHFAFDISRARSELGYSPQTLAQRIAQYVGELQRDRLVVQQR